MRDRGHIVNAEKLNIHVTAYLVLEFMHYNDVHLNYSKPKGITYMGLTKELYRSIVKTLADKGYIKKHTKGVKGDFILTPPLKKRMDNMVGTKMLVEDLFDKFIEVYPNKSGKKTAKSAFSKLPFNKESNLFDEIMKGVKDRLKHEEKAPPKEFVPLWPMPSTYINGERWNDELIPWSDKNGEGDNSITFKPKTKERL